MEKENSSTVKHKPDAMCKDFYASDERFSDFVNGAFFDGEQVIDASMISDYDSDVSTYNDEESRNSYHDVVKCVNINGLKVLVVFENQSTYCAEMLSRIKEYDSNLFQKEFHRYLASKRTRSIPDVINLVLNYNSVPWYGPRCYEDIVEPAPEVFRAFTGQKMFPIIDIISLDESKFQNKDNRDMIGGLKKLYQWKGNTRALEGMVVSKAVALVLAAMMGDYSFLELVEKERGEVNMCESFRRFKESAINEGVAQGYTLGINEGEAKGEIKTLIQQLNHKLGKLSENIVEKIQNSSKEQLDQLVIKVFEIQSQDDLNKILA